MADRPRVLVTGATGYIASMVLPELGQRYDLRLSDVRPLTRDGRALEGLVVADLLAAPDSEVRALFEGCDAVVHLAYYRTDVNAPQWSSVSGYGEERANVDLVERVLTICAQTGVGRAVIASSNHAADWYEHLIRAQRLDVLDPDTTVPKSDNYYGWAKAAYEHLGFVHASGGLGHRVENVHIRIGAPREIHARTFYPDGPGRPGDEVGYRRDLAAYISARDLAQLVVKSIDTPSIEDAYGIPFQVFYGTSGNARTIWSIANARRVIGYAPDDDSEVRFAEEIRAHLL
jgi:nucleoside-diphosphate-sugar epimerase